MPSDKKAHTSLAVIGAAFVLFSQLNATDAAEPRMPTPAQAIRRTTHERHATAFNYRTFNYTMAWWNAERWEREIDLLALQGIDQPLAVVGTEAIWFNVLKRIG